MFSGNACVVLSIYSDIAPLLLFYCSSKEELPAMTAELQRRYQIKGAAFGARGCSCSPCDCNPCTCGDEVRPPSWRICSQLSPLS
jgi:hypothetical protein